MIYTPARVQGLVGLNVDGTTAQFSAMQCGMDLLCSPLPEQRLQERRFQQHSADRKRSSSTPFGTLDDFFHPAHCERAPERASSTCTMQVTVRLVALPPQ